MQGPAILQLRVDPPIWRRLQLSDRCTFWDLHVAIQCAFGWNDSHLHEFRPWGRSRKGAAYGIPEHDGFDFGASTLPGWEHRVGEVLNSSNRRYLYEYDFGDSWQHLIALEKRLAAEPGTKYPRCIAGERAGPPDDCGGPGGWAQLLRILADRNDPEHVESHEWASSQKGKRGKFKPDVFDATRVRFANPTARLRQMLSDVDDGS
jgi:hypothetical protein